MGGLIRDLFAAIDSSIYGFITYIYRILMNIADVQIFSSEALKSFSERVYALLAIFMAFKLIFTFINYAVNPDQLTNEKTGGKKLIMNIMISLVLLIAVPGIIFPLSRRIQYAILNEGVLQEIILGVDQQAYSQSKNTLRAGRSMSYSVLNAFFTPNPPSVGDDAYCNDETIRFYDNGKEGTCDGGDCANEEAGLKNLRFQLDGTCAKAINEALKDTGVDAETVVTTYERAYNQFSTKILLGGAGDYDLKRIKTKDGEYLFDYRILLSTIAGLAVGWMLVVFCFQIAVRTIKLGFLELVAPIPILSYIDAKAKSKSFDGWVKSCISAYLDLFVRLAALYFAIFVISSISIGDLTYASHSFTSQEGDPETVGLIVKFFIIMGALMFAEKVPKLIEDIFGIKLDGSFSLNPFKNSPLAAKVFGGAVGLTAGAALGGAANIGSLAMRAKENRKLRADLKAANGGTDDAEKYHQQKDKWLRSAPQTIAGGIISGGARSMVSGYKSKDGFKGAITGVTASSRSRNQRATGYGGLQRFLNEATDIAGIQNPKTGTMDTFDSETKAMKQQLNWLTESLSSASEAIHHMFRENVQALKGVINPATGNWTYNNYNEYLTQKKEEIIKNYEASAEFKKMVKEAQEDFGNDVEGYNAFIGTMKETAINQEIDKAMNTGKIASEDLYENYHELHNEFVVTRDTSVKLKKDITRREELSTKNKK